MPRKRRICLNCIHWAVSYCELKNPDRPHLIKAIDPHTLACERFKPWWAIE